VPPIRKYSIADGIRSCEDGDCIEKLVMKFLEDLRRGNLEYTSLPNGDDEVSEKEIFNSLLFYSKLIEKLEYMDLDLIQIAKVLEELLGPNHPVVLLLKREETE